MAPASENSQNTARGLIASGSEKGSLLGEGPTFGSLPQLPHRNQIDPGGVHPTKQSMWTAVIPALFVGCVATHSGNTPNTAAELDKAEVRC